MYKSFNFDNTNYPRTIVCGIRVTIRMIRNAIIWRSVYRDVASLLSPLSESRLPAIADARRIRLSTFHVTSFEMIGGDGLMEKDDDRRRARIAAPIR